MSFITKKGTRGLDKIKKLKFIIEWIEFIKQIRLYLLINRYRDLLKWNAKRLKQRALLERAYKTKLNTWLNKLE